MFRILTASSIYIPDMQILLLISSQDYYVKLPPTRNDRTFCDNLVICGPMKLVSGLKMKVWELTDLMRYKLWL